MNARRVQSERRRKSRCYCTFPRDFPLTLITLAADHFIVLAQYAFLIHSQSCPLLSWRKLNSLNSLLSHLKKIQTKRKRELGERTKGFKANITIFTPQGAHREPAAFLEIIGCIFPRMQRARKHNCCSPRMHPPTCTKIFTWYICCSSILSLVQFWFSIVSSFHVLYFYTANNFKHNIMVTKLRNGEVKWKMLNGVKKSSHTKLQKIFLINFKKQTFMETKKQKLISLSRRTNK